MEEEIAGGIPGAAPAAADPAAVCPSCKRFVGPRARCPFCGAGMRMRMSVRVFRWGSAAIAVAGLVFLYVWARSRDIPEIKLADVTETMNMAYVQVSGEVGRVSSSRDKKGALEYLTFDLDDGTAVARVKANRHAASALEARGTVPRTGDRVKVSGSVRIGEEGQISLFLQTATHFELAPVMPEKHRVSELDSSMIGKVVLTEGRVGSVLEPREGSKAPFKIILRDENGSAALVVWQRLWADLGERKPIVGSSVSVRATVGEHGGKIQLTLEDPADLKIDSQAAPPPRSPDDSSAPEFLDPGSVNASMAGRKTRVRGMLEKITPPPGKSRRPGVLLLSGGGAVAEMVAWSETFEDLLGKGIEEGDTVEALVSVDIFKGKIQLVINGASDLEVREKAKKAGLEPGAWIAPDRVGRKHLGLEISTGGAVESVTRYAHGLKVMIGEGDDALEIFVKKAAAEGVEGIDSLDRGAKVRAAGKVSEYRSRLQVMVAAPGGFTIEAPASNKPAEAALPEPRKAASITAGDKGKIVALEGKVLSVQQMSKGSKAVLDDGSGRTIAVIVWDTVREKMQDSSALAAGRVLRVLGRVGEYKGELQVVPEEGWDVVALEGGERK